MRNVIIYGINWTNCYALQSIFKQKYPEKCVKTCNSLTALLHSIRYAGRRADFSFEPA